MNMKRFFFFAKKAAPRWLLYSLAIEICVSILVGGHANPLDYVAHWLMWWVVGTSLTALMDTRFAKPEST